AVSDREEAIGDCDRGREVLDVVPYEGRHVEDVSRIEHDLVGRRVRTQRERFRSMCRIILGMEVRSTIGLGLDELLVPGRPEQPALPAMDLNEGIRFVSAVDRGSSTGRGDEELRELAQREPASEPGEERHVEVRLERGIVVDEGKKPEAFALPGPDGVDQRTEILDDAAAVLPIAVQ